MTITSPAFEDKQSLPTKYTCDGEGVNPPLQFNEIPVEAKSLVLLMDDPDVPSGQVFDHWVIYNIDPKIKRIEENSAPSGLLGLNSAHTTDYFAACPPDGEHRYFFKLYALDALLPFETTSEVTRQMIEEKMQGHILEQAELVGLYNRIHNR